eukprot:1631126-Rhodomonas_salina.1
MAHVHWLYLCYANRKCPVQGTGTTERTIWVFKNGEPDMEKIQAMKLILLAVRFEVSNKCVKFFFESDAGQYCGIAMRADGGYGVNFSVYSPFSDSDISVFE